MCRLMPDHVRKANMICSWCKDDPKLMCWECAEALTIIDDVVLRVKGSKQERLLNKAYEPFDWDQFLDEFFGDGLYAS